jgi:multimeric flavodoxin WrbA
MKILVINGSPRGKKGATFLMAEEFLRGVESVGGETEHILLSEKKIHHCVGCFTCWTKTPGVCIFEDDMKELLNKSCDVLVFASPLYVDNISGLLKNFMDRTLPSALPLMAQDKRGETVHEPRSPPPKILLLSNCGFPEMSHFQVISHLFKRVARNMRTELIGEILCPEGPLLLFAEGEVAQIVENYKKLLQQAGREVVQKLKISRKTRKALQKPLIPKKIYIQEVNKSFLKF